MRIVFLAFTVLMFFSSCSEEKKSMQERTLALLESEVLSKADQFLAEEPVTVTRDSSERSVGGLHDFYSEGDYWWPNPDDPNGPYMRKDGLTNPDNFIAHRTSLMRFSEIVGTLTSAYVITGDKRYSESALAHCKAWLIDPKTKMNPHFLYSQAIEGRFTGRGIGIIDAIHFMDVAQSLKVLEQGGKIGESESVSYKQWFKELVNWLTTNPYGIAERDWSNNHATWWNAQVASYADYIEDEEVMRFCIENFKNNLLPNQTSPDGSFPEEVARTKPYSYSLFNLDAMGMFCLIASDKQNDLWRYEVDGKSVAKALAYMSPYIKDKQTWPYDPDVQYWNNWPVAHPSFLFGAIALENETYFSNWKDEKHFLEEYEIRRTVANKSPIVWLSQLEKE